MRAVGSTRRIARSKTAHSFSKWKSSTMRKPPFCR